MASRLSMFSSPQARTRARWKPQGIDHLLVDVALHPCERGRESWHELRHHLVFDDIDENQQRLMPMVHRSLISLGIDDGDLGRMKGLHRNYWYRNQKLLSDTESALLALTEAGIDVMAMKGLPLSIAHYPDVGLRPMANVDILVPFSKYLPALDILESCGYDVARPSARSFQMVHGATAARHPNGTVINVHWQLHPALSIPGAPAHWGSDFWVASINDNEIWERSLPFSVGSAHCRVLSPEDLLLHVCVHGVYSLLAPMVQWTVDATMIIRSSETFDWQKLIETARRRRVIVGLRETLRYLANDLDADIPVEVKQQLEEIEPNVRELFIFRSISRPRHLGRIRRTLLTFLLVTSRESRTRVLSAFPAFIRSAYDSGAARKLLNHLLIRFFQVPGAFGTRSKSSTPR